MSDFKVAALKADEGGCGYFRVDLPARYANQTGDVSVEVKKDLDGDITIHPDQHITVHSIETDADVIVFQRPLLGAFTQAIQQAQKQGITCIVELDDDLASCHPENLAFNEVDPKQNPYANWQHLKKSMALADWCIVSTPSLARRYAPHGRVSVVRNVLPESTWKLEKTFTDRARVGWTGSIITHPRDLEAAGAHVATVLKNTGTSLSVIGDGEQVREKLLLPDSVELDVHGWRDFDEYHSAIAELIDIGIVPLEDSIFNRGKSYLKGLEFAACGVPFIASPTDEYVRFANEMKIGKIARKGNDWQRYIKSLVSNRDFLLEESARVRDASRGLTYENHIGEWIDAWRAGLEHRTKVRGKTS